MTGGQLRLGRVAGFPVAVHWSVLLIVGLLTWALAGGVLPQAAPGHSDLVYVLLGLLGAVLLLAAVLAHELAHALTARRAGVAVDGITLWMFGGVSLLRSEAPTPDAELRIALAGPATSLGVAVLSGAVAVLLPDVRATEPLIATAWWLAVINLVLGTFNLVPGSPLDGGRVLRALIWRRTGDRELATRSAARAGVTVATGMIVVGALLFVLGDVVDGVWTALIGWFLLSSAKAEQAGADAGRLLAGITVAQVMSAPVETASADATVQEFVTRQVLTGHHSAVPLLDVAGQVVGVVTLRALHAVPPANRDRVRVREVAVSRDRLVVADPEEEVTAVLSRMTPESGTRALVFAQDQLVGILTSSDVSRLISLRGMLAER